MDPHRLERLVAGALSAALIFLGAKLGLSQQTLAMIAGTGGLVLALGPVHNAIDKFAAGKAGADLSKFLAVGQQLSDAIKQAKASQAAQAGKDAAAAAGSPGGPSQA